MTTEIPGYCLRAYALFFSRHGTKEPFRQSDLSWIVSQSMQKKIFSILVNAGWIEKQSRNTYRCISPDNAMEGLLEFKVPKIIKKAQKPYAFTNLSAIEIWSDYVYVQRGIERSPYFIKVLKKDVKYWKAFFNKYHVPNYVGEGSTIGEYVILIPAASLHSTEKKGMYVEPLKDTMRTAMQNEMYSYPYNYMREKYGSAAA